MDNKTIGAVVGTALVTSGVFYFSGAEAEVTKIDDSRFTITKEVSIDYSLPDIQGELESNQARLGETIATCSREQASYQEKIVELEGLILKAKSAGLKTK
jgi:hypothetical protein